MATLSEEARAGLRCRPPGLAPEHKLIIDLIPEGSRVLDLGCGHGELLQALMQTKRVRGEGIELSPECIQACVARGVSNVHQTDLDEGLGEYADQSVDYVILTNTIQVLHRPLPLLQEVARVGKQGIVSFPNFAHWSVRWQLLTRGRMPKTPNLPYEWYDTPNIHLTTIKDFEQFCATAGLEVLEKIPLRTHRATCRRVTLLPNLLADQAVFVVRAAAAGPVAHDATPAVWNRAAFRT
jgi:methionine biosynthesis protein MetW